MKKNRLAGNLASPIQREKWQIETQRLFCYCVCMHAFCPLAMGHVAIHVFFVHMAKSFQVTLMDLLKAGAHEGLKR